MELPADVVETYWVAMTAIVAEEMVLAMKVSDYPHMQQKERSRVHKSLYKKAYPEQKERSMTWEDLARVLNG